MAHGVGAKHDGVPSPPGRNVDKSYGHPLRTRGVHSSVFLHAAPVHPPMLFDSGMGNFLAHWSTTRRGQRWLPPRLLVTWMAIGAIVMLAGSFGGPVARRPAVDAEVHTVSSGTQYLFPYEIPFSSGDIPNPLRGQYTWMSWPPSPSGTTAPDYYEREQTGWGMLEPTRGNYDFSVIEDGLQKAAADGGRFGFRVVAWCPGCSFPGSADVTPSWLPRQTSVPANPPQWDSAIFQDAWEDLMEALGDEFGDDPRLGFVDVGGFGAWGEWHTVVAGDENDAGITEANEERMINAVLDAFPMAEVLISASSREYATIGIGVSPRVGLRVDCLGAPGMLSALSREPLLQDRWLTAPVVTEWCYDETDTVLGAQQVQDYHVSMVASGNLPDDYDNLSPAQQQGFLDAVSHSGYRYFLNRVEVPASVSAGERFPVALKWVNRGSAPTYEDWSVRLLLLDSNGTVVGDRDVASDLREVIDDQTPTYRSHTVFPRVQPGTYQVAVSVIDPDGYLEPMRLAVEGRTADGYYPVGSIDIVAP